MSASSVLLVLLLAVDQGLSLLGKSDLFRQQETERQVP